MNVAPRDLSKHADLAAHVPATTECVPARFYVCMGVSERLGGALFFFYVCEDLADGMGVGPQPSNDEILTFQIVT